MVEKLLSTLSLVMNCSQQNKYKIDHFTLNQTNGEEEGGASLNREGLETVFSLVDERQSLQLSDVWPCCFRLTR